MTKRVSLPDLDAMEVVTEIITLGVSARVLRVRPGGTQLLIRIEWFDQSGAGWMPLVVLTPAQASSVSRALSGVLDRIPELSPKLGLEPDPALAAALSRLAWKLNG